jgi:hypothetical protein
MSFFSANRTYGNGPCEVGEFYMHAALLVEPLPPRVLRFALGDVSQDVLVDFSEGQTMRDVISMARNVPDGNSLFSGSRIASALDPEAAGARAADGGGLPSPSPSPWSLTFELKDPSDEETASSSFSQDAFLGLTPQDIVGTVPMEANPIVIAVRLEKRELEEDTAASTKLSDA